jgi:hypothetical protein
VIEQVQSGAVDSARMYVAGRADLVFYAVSRVPDLWAAAAAVGGDPKAAVLTGKLYAANSQLAPLLWADTADTPTARKLAAAGFRMERRKASEAEALEFLASHRREEFPYKIECETGSPAFARCYWIQMTKFDPSRRNDVLRSSRVAPGAGATLALGSFGYAEGGPGQGVLIESPPAGGQGPLKAGDRIVSVGGAKVSDVKDYEELMDTAKEEKPVAITIMRGKERLRVETRILFPKREEGITAHVRAEFSMESKDLIISTRTVTEMRLLVPDNWAGAVINWNGNEVAGKAAAGCWMITETPAPSAAPCR